MCTIFEALLRTILLCYDFKPCLHILVSIVVQHYLHHNLFSLQHSSSIMQRKKFLSLPLPSSSSSWPIAYEMKRTSNHLLMKTQDDEVDQAEGSRKQEPPSMHGWRQISSVASHGSMCGTCKSPSWYFTVIVSVVVHESLPPFNTVGMTCSILSSSSEGTSYRLPSE